MGGMGRGRHPVTRALRSRCHAGQPELGPDGDSQPVWSMRLRVTPQEARGLKDLHPHSRRVRRGVGVGGGCSG